MIKNFRFRGLFFLLLILTGLNSCVEDRVCPPEFLCITGNTVQYQEGAGRPAISIEAPPEAVFNNVQIFITDLSNDPLLGQFADRFYGRACFRIEPGNLSLRQLVKITLEYPQGSTIDSLGNDFGPEMRLYQIDEDGNWSLIPASLTDTSRRITFGQVLNLGKFAIAAPKNCIVGEWWADPATGPFGFSSRLRFWKNGLGDKAEVIDCDPSGSESFELSTSTFSWKIEDGKLVLFNISGETACGNTTPPQTTTLITTYDCDFDEFVLNLGGGPVSFNRRF